jgi:hypothetical protein
VGQVADGLVGDGVLGDVGVQHPGATFPVGLSLGLTTHAVAVPVTASCVTGAVVLRVRRGCWSGTSQLTTVSANAATASSGILMRRLSDIRRRATRQMRVTACRPGSSFRPHAGGWLSDLEARNPSMPGPHRQPAGSGGGAQVRVVARGPDRNPSTCRWWPTTPTRNRRS